MRSIYDTYGPGPAPAKPTSRAGEAPKQDDGPPIRGALQMMLEAPPYDPFPTEGLDITPEARAEIDRFKRQCEIENQLAACRYRNER